MNWKPTYGAGGLHDGYLPGGRGATDRVVNNGTVTVVGSGGGHAGAILGGPSHKYCPEDQICEGKLVLFLECHRMGDRTPAFLDVIDDAIEELQALKARRT